MASLDKDMSKAQKQSEEIFRAIEISKRKTAQVVQEYSKHITDLEVEVSIKEDRLFEEFDMEEDIFEHIDKQTLIKYNDFINQQTLTARSIREFIQEDMKRGYYSIDGFLPYSVQRARNRLGLKNNFLTIMAELERLIRSNRSGKLEEKILREEVKNNVIGNIPSFTPLQNILCDEISHFLVGLFHMPAITYIPKERIQNYSGTTPTDVGYAGISVPDLLFRNPELVTKINEWFEKLNIGFNIIVPELKMQKSGIFTNPSRYYSIRLVDLKSGVDNSLQDTGTGVGQIIPFIIQALVSTKQTTLKEEPEGHLHPKWQSGIADLLSYLVKEKPANRKKEPSFIIETHSEHLVLRLKKIISEGFDPDLVSINYIYRDENKGEARIDKIRLNKDGDFIDEWKDGFFPERLAEL